MQLSILQFAPIWLNPQENLKIISDWCKQLQSGTDILLLPEMFNTGYVLNPNDLDIHWQDETIGILKQLASKFQILIGGSIPIIRNGLWFNAFIFVDKNGLQFHYDKIQLFSMAGEQKHYTPGKVIKYFKYKSFKILPFVCYDLRFPNLSFTHEVPDLIIYSANWPKTRIGHWDKLLPARAIENLCYVAGINRIGTDHNGFEYPGHSSIVDFNGNTVLNLDTIEGIKNIVLDMDAMIKMRRYYGFLKDRRFN